MAQLLRFLLNLKHFWDKNKENLHLRTKLIYSRFLSEFQPFLINVNKYYRRGVKKWCGLEIRNLYYRVSVNLLIQSSRSKQASSPSF